MAARTRRTTASAHGIEREERGEVDLGEGRRKGEREGGKWERWVEAEASWRPYPLPALASTRWSGGDVPL